MTGPELARQHKEGTPIMTTDTAPVQAVTPAGAERGGYYCQNPNCAGVSTYPSTCCGLPMVAR